MPLSDAAGPVTAAEESKEDSRRPHFYNKKGPGRTSQLPRTFDQLGLLLLILYIAAFGFYLFTRSTTDSMPGTLVAYQIAMLVAEGFVFLSGLVFGLWQVRALHCLVHAR
jgi:hypothetical protein